jgi:hypothetical protein
MTNWNYRVIYTPTNQENSFAIHEVFYNDEGLPIGATKNPVELGASSMEDLQLTVDRLKDAMDKPILCGDERFPGEYRPREND